jgi:hypothetical protein
MQKQSTIAATMRKLMASGPSITEFPSYKSLNDFVGGLHGLAKGRCQALAGAKAWAWAKDEVTGKWRPATPEEFAAKKEAAACKNSGGSRKAKVMGDAERATLDAQVAALEAVDNPALAPLLAGLKTQQAADDQARKGSLKDRLQAAIDKLGLVQAVTLLEEAADAVWSPRPPRMRP